VEFVADFADIGGGYGGYNQDHEFFGYRQSISPLPAPRSSRLSAGTPTGFPSFDADRRVTPAVGKHGTRYISGIDTEGEVLMEKSSLTALARQQLVLAQDAASRRSSHTVYGATSTCCARP
jgi:hypothetical protein